MKLLSGLLLVLTLVALSGCGDLAVTPEAATAAPAVARPADFMVEYIHADGSMPPPFHTEYRITLNPDGSGMIEFSPDYPGGATPIWTTPITPTSAQLDQLYALFSADVVKADLTKDDRVGGEWEAMVVKADGQQYEIPPLANPAPVTAFYEQLNGLIPEAVWNDFNTRKQEYDQQ